MDDNAHLQSADDPLPLVVAVVDRFLLDCSDIPVLDKRSIVKKGERVPGL